MKLSNMMSGLSANILSRLEDRRREIVAAGGEVINLSAGTPDLPPAKHVMEALASAVMDPEQYKYAISDSPELLQAAADWYKRRYGVTVERDQITSLYGSQEGIAHVTFPLCDPGDVVLVPDPCYPIFSFGPTMRGARLEYIPLKRENGFLIDFDAIDPDLAREAKLIIVSYPNNPTTATASPAFYEKLIAFAKKYDIIVLHDNAYSELVLDGEPGRSFLSFPGAMDVGIEFNSLSKSYNLTGMRISFALGNREIIAALRKFRSQIDYGPFPAIQKAAIAALSGPQDILDSNRKEYKLRRDALCNGLRRIGWNVPDCDGTMFAWFPLPNGLTDDEKFVFDLLEQTGVIGVPGSSFGKAGEGFIRFALIQPVEVLERAVEKIAASGLVGVIERNPTR
jgi:LL-diaminopimelate aminotransferase